LLFSILGTVISKDKSLYKLSPYNFLLPDKLPQWGEHVEKTGMGSQKQIPQEARRQTLLLVSPPLPLVIRFQGVDNKGVC
jgi:hypothetical protein